MNDQQDMLHSISSIIAKNVNECDANYIIGIDGYSCAGKTSFTEQLRKYNISERPVLVFHIDDYIRPSKFRYHTGYEQWVEHFFLQWDTSHICENLFRAIKDNKSQIKLQHYCKGKDSVSEYIYEIPSKSIIIIEGVFLQRVEWRKYFDYVVFMDCPREIRFQREVIRSNHSNNLDHVISHYRERYWAAEDYYDKTYKPLEASDVIIRNY